MFSRSSLYRELMTHREKLGTTDNEKPHQRQQMTRIKTTVVARSIYTLRPPVRNHSECYERKNCLPCRLYPEMHVRECGVRHDLTCLETRIGRNWQRDQKSSSKVKSPPFSPFSSEGESSAETGFLVLAMTPAFW